MRGDGQLQRFARAMRRELRANAYKGAWTGLGWTPKKHLKEIDYHVAKLKAAIRAGDEPARVLEFAADVANHTMFLVDDLGALTEDVLMRRYEEPSFVKPAPGVYWRLLFARRWWRKGIAGVRAHVEHEDHERREWHEVAPGLRAFEPVKAGDLEAAGPLEDAIRENIVAEWDGLGIPVSGTMPGPLPVADEHPGTKSAYVPGEGTSMF